MRKTLLIAGILITGTFLISFSPKPVSLEASLAEALADASNIFFANLKSLGDAQKNYLQTAEAFALGQTSVTELKNNHLATRRAFKKAEYLIEYLDHDVVKLYLNGAPLPAVDRSQPGILILEPEGLQVLDELVFSDDPESEKEAILDMVHKLDLQMGPAFSSVRISGIQHRFIFEAAREEIIRIFTLGLTGFDTPGGSEQAVDEAYVALSAVNEGLAGYIEGAKISHPELADNLAVLFSGAEQYLLDHPDFESFDRTHFLREYVNPLFARILDLQLRLGIETHRESTVEHTPYDYEASSFFQSDFFNSSFYANTTEEAIQKRNRVELGRMLFFDPILSSNNERSCASCHHPDKAFTDGLDKSLAMGGEGKIQRNAPTLINALFAEKYFYDLREHSLARQIKHVVLNQHEFDTDFFEILDKLKQSREYHALFEEAYSDKLPEYRFTKWSFSNAIATYLTTLASFNSPFDQYVRGETEEIDPAVARGFNIFMGKGACGTCHFAPTFNGLVPPRFQDSESEVLGVPANKDTLNPPLDPDPGRIASGVPHDQAYFYAFSFKTPTVRNIELTAPYMHNGVYGSLEEVMDFYNRGGGKGMGIVLPHQTLPFDNLNLTREEIGDVIAFMESLTDTTGMTTVPARLPEFENKPEWNDRKIGGVY